MPDFDVVRLVVVIVFALNALLLTSLVLAKVVHRRWTLAHVRRRSDYVKILSRHLALPDEVITLDKRAASDRAFLDALIDVRNSVTGPESDALSGLVEDLGIAESEARWLRRRFFLARRLQAAVTLAELADARSARSLLAHLSDRDPAIRIQCARGLGRMRWTPAIDAIVSRFHGEIPWVRTRFAESLISFRQEATSPLLTYIKVNHRHEREGCVAALGTLATIGDRDAVMPLIDMLKEIMDPEVTIATIGALGALGSPQAIPSLLSLTSSPDWRVRAKVATALGDIGEPSLIPMLAVGLTDQNWWVRRNSAAALARMPGGTVALHEALHSIDRFARDAAVEALAAIGEVLAARERVDRGEGTQDDLHLLGYIDGSLVRAS